MDSVIMAASMIEPTDSADNLKFHIFNVIDKALAQAGFKIMDGDSNSVIIRHAPSDTEFEIQVEEIAG